MKRFGNFLLCFVPFFLAEAVQVITVLFGRFLYMITIIVLYLTGIYKGKDLTLGGMMDLIMDDLNEMGNVSYMISVCAIAACGIVFFIWYRKLTSGEYKGKPIEGFTFSDGLVIALLGLGCQLLVTGVMGLIQPFFLKVFEDYSDNIDQLIGADPGLVMLLVVLIAPIAEELIFRGVMMHKLEKQISFLGANLLQALVFGIYHLNLVQGIYAFLLGLVLGYVTKKYNSLIVSIMLHCIINGLAFLVVIFEASTLIYVIFTLVGFIFVGASIYRIHNRNSINTCISGKNKL